MSAKEKNPARLAIPLAWLLTAALSATPGALAADAKTKNPSSRAPAQQSLSDRAPMAPCMALPWTHPRNLGKQDQVKLFRRTGREQLVRHFIAEVTQPAPGLTAHYLGIYLLETENDPELRAFFDLVRWGAEIKAENPRPRRLDFVEVCDLYDQVRNGGIGNGPSR